MTKNKCMDPTKIQEGDLISYLHGDASQGIVEHIAHCAFCAQEVERLRTIDSRLVAAFYRDTCPSPDLLAGFVLDQLPATERLRVSAHVRTCSACSGEIASMRGTTDQEPASLLARLRQSLALALVTRPVIAATAPARGGQAQGRFETGDFVVTLSLRPTSVVGRLRRRNSFGATDYAGQAWLVGKAAEGEGQAVQSRVDERGRFEFTGLAAGAYALLLQIGDQDLAVEAVQVS